MIQAKHTRFYIWFFRIFSDVMIHRHFSKVEIKGNFQDQGLPVLLIGNHFSWWDGFFANYLNTKIFKKIFHVMMLEEQLKQRMFLNKAGAFSIDKGKRSMIETLSYAGELLKNKENLLVLYPQGKFQSVHHRPIQFEKGFIAIPRSAAVKGFQLIFYAALTDYFEHRNPMLFLYIKEQPFLLEMTASDLEFAYNEFYENSIKLHEESL